MTRRHVIPRAALGKTGSDSATMSTKFKVVRFENCAHTPCIPLIAQAWHELLESGLAPWESNYNWDNKAVAAFGEGALDAIGIVTYTLTEWRRAMFLQLVYTHPAYRRQGIVELLFAEVEQIARTKDVAVIEFGTHVDNKRMQQAGAKLGFSPVFLTMQHRIAGR